MSAWAYCDPEWHGGEHVEADYVIRPITLTSDALAIRTAWVDSQVDRMEMFCCCRADLEAAVRLMIARHGPDVRIREARRPARGEGVAS